MPIVIEAPKPHVRMEVAIPKNLRIVFFGTPLVAVPSLRRISEDGWPIAMVVTAPDKPVGRKMLLTPSAVRSAAETMDLPVRSPATLSDELFWQDFSELRPDICIVIAYGKLIPKRYLDVPRLGFLNVHPSLLPAYRGASPIQSAIMDGCASTGVSIMRLDEEMDHGPVLATESWPIPSGFDAPACTDELARIGADLLATTLPGYIEGTIIGVPQDHSSATYTKKFGRSDGKLDWKQTAVRISDKIRALGANPGTWTTVQGKILNIFHARIADSSLPSSAPGTVMQHAGDIAISCGSGALILETVQLEGGSRMAATDFARGRPALIGTILT